MGTAHQLCATGGLSSSHANATPRPGLPAVLASCPHPGIDPSNPVTTAIPVSTVLREHGATSLPLLGLCFLEAVVVCFGSCFKFSPWYLIKLEAFSLWRGTVGSRLRLSSLETWPSCSVLCGLGRNCSARVSSSVGRQ